MPTVGKAIKAHGIRGDIKVENYMDTPDCFTKLSQVVINDEDYEVEHSRVNGGFVLLKLKGVDTMNAAEAFRGALILCDKKRMPALPKGRYYIEDLIGCEVFSDGNRCGRLKEILQNGSADVYVLQGEGKEIMFPLADGVLETVDTEKRTITVNAEKFAQVAVYED